MGWGDEVEYAIVINSSPHICLHDNQESDIQDHITPTLSLAMLNLVTRRTWRTYDSPVAPERGVPGVRPGSLAPAPETMAGHRSRARGGEETHSAAFRCPVIWTLRGSAHTADRQGMKTTYKCVWLATSMGDRQSINDQIQHGQYHQVPPAHGGMPCARGVGQ